MCSCARQRQRAQAAAPAAETLPALPLPLGAPATAQGPRGSAADKLRLALVQLLAAEVPPSEAELQELTSALHAAGVADTTAVTYVARLRRNRLVGSARPAAGAAAAPVVTGAALCCSAGALASWQLALRSHCTASCLACLLCQHCCVCFVPSCSLMPAAQSH